jgi:hypothetical protein
VGLFGALPSLSEIIIYQNEREFFSALIDGTDPERPDAVGSCEAPLPFQTLKKIEVILAGSLEYLEEDVRFMLKCLQKRRDLGMGLKTLVFSVNCCKDEINRQVSAFKDVVEQMVVEYYP